MKKYGESSGVNERKMCNCHCEDAIDDSEVSSYSPDGAALMGFLCP